MSLLVPGALPLVVPRILVDRRYYLADPHIDHANIMRYCHRPFASPGAMMHWLTRVLSAVDDGGGRLVVPGDFCFQPRRLAERWRFVHPERHALTAGNHDPINRPSDAALFAPWFGTVEGLRGTWRSNRLILDDTLHGRPVRVLVSHEPQRDLGGCDVNVYGHHHNNMTRYPERFAATYGDWLFGSPRHANAGVELHGYVPVLLDTLFPVDPGPPPVL